MEAVADRLSLRWYVGYDLHEPLPDLSSLTRIRERYGLGVFRENPCLRLRGSPCSRYLVRVA
jgi:IS5 family transposase